MRAPLPATALCLAATGVLADSAPPAVKWVETRTEQATETHRIGRYTPASQHMIGVDSLTYMPSYEWPYFDIPAGPADLYVLVEPEYGRNSKAVLVFSDAAPACGFDIATMGVDTGTGAFPDRRAALVLEALSDTLNAQGKNIYNDFLEAQMPDDSFARFITLPDGTRFPAFSTGWGDGGYPVATLIDTRGSLIAVYADFMGRNEAGEWLLPDPCSS